MGDGDPFPLNLMRMMAAEMHFQSALLASREMFGRSYFSLGVPEKAAVDQAVIAFVGSNYRDITPELLAGQEQRPPVGFGIPKDLPSNPSPSEAVS